MLEVLGCTLTGLCSSRVAAFCSGVLQDGGEELPAHFFRARRQLLCAGFPIQGVSAGHSSGPWG